MTMDDRPHDPTDPLLSPGSSDPSGGLGEPDGVDVVASAIVDGEPLPAGADAEDPRVIAAVAAFREVAAQVGDVDRSAHARDRDQGLLRAAIAAASIADEPAAEHPGGADVVPLAPRRRALSSKVVGVAAALLLAVGVGGLALRQGGGTDDRELSTAASDSAGDGEDLATTGGSATGPTTADEAAPTEQSSGSSAVDDAAEDSSTPPGAAAELGPQAPATTISPSAARMAGLIDLGDVGSLDGLRSTVRDLLSSANAHQYADLGRRDAEHRCATAVSSAGVPVAVARVDGRDVIAVIRAESAEVVVIHLDDCTIAAG